MKGLDQQRRPVGHLGLEMLVHALMKGPLRSGAATDPPGLGTTRQWMPR